MPYVNLETGKMYRVNSADIAVPAKIGIFGNWEFVDRVNYTDLSRLYREIVMLVGFKYHDSQSLRDEPVLVVVLHGEKLYILGRHQLEAITENP